MNKKGIVWFIDENEDELATCGEILEIIFSNEAVVRLVEPKPSKEEMKFIVDDPLTISIIIDERLKDTGIANYLGIDLARYFRALNNKLPIYILTNHPNDEDDLSPGEWSIESIIGKKDLYDKLDTIKARMLRRILTYNDYLDKREKRFTDLLRRSISETISEDEMAEFKELQYIRSASILVDEINSSAKLELIIKEQLEILDKLRKDIKSKK